MNIRTIATEREQQDISFVVEKVIEILIPDYGFITLRDNEIPNKLTAVLQQDDYNSLRYMSTSLRLDIYRALIYLDYQELANKFQNLENFL